MAQNLNRFQPPRRVAVRTNPALAGLWRQLITQHFNGAKVPLTVLREEVAVNDFYQAVKFLDGETAHGNVQDEFSKEFATHKGTGKNILNHLQKV